MKGVTEEKVTPCFGRKRGETFDPGDRYGKMHIRINDKKRTVCGLIVVRDLTFVEQRFAPIAHIGRRCRNCFILP